jgi:hypothetical protein
LLDLLFDPEDGGDMFLRNVVTNPEDRTVHSHRRENLKSNMKTVFIDRSSVFRTDEILQFSIERKLDNPN